MPDTQKCPACSSKEIQIRAFYLNPRNGRRILAETKRWLFSILGALLVGSGGLLYIYSETVNKEASGDVQVTLNAMLIFVLSGVLVFGGIWFLAMRSRPGKRQTRFVACTCENCQQSWEAAIPPRGK